MPFFQHSMLIRTHAFRAVMRKQDQLLRTYLFFKRWKSYLPKRMHFMFLFRVVNRGTAAPKCGTWTSNISITQKPAGDAGSWALFQTYNIRISRIYGLTNSLIIPMYTHTSKTTKEHPKIISRTSLKLKRKRSNFTL